MNTAHKIHEPILNWKAHLGHLSLKLYKKRWSIYIYISIYVHVQLYTLSRAPQNSRVQTELDKYTLRDY